MADTVKLDSILAALAAVGVRLPDASVVPLLSFVAALQYTSLNRVGAWPFSSAMMTGNLRDVTASLVQWSAGRETAANRSKAITLTLICVSFVIGALCGGCYTRLNGVHALVPCVAIVATGFLLTCWERRRFTQMSTAASTMNYPGLGARFFSGRLSGKLICSRLDSNRKARMEASVFRREVPVPSTRRRAHESGIPTPAFGGTEVLPLRFA